MKFSNFHQPTGQSFTYQVCTFRNHIPLPNPVRRCLLILSTKFTFECLNITQKYRKVPNTSPISTLSCKTVVCVTSPIGTNELVAHELARRSLSKDPLRLSRAPESYWSPQYMPMQCHATRCHVNCIRIPLSRPNRLG